MASPQMRMHSEIVRAGWEERRSRLRLLGIERSEEIYPVLLEEIVALGHPRALITQVNFETSEISPRRLAELLQKSPSTLSHFPVFAVENSHSQCPARLEPEIVPNGGRSSVDLYYQPMVYRNQDGMLGG